MCNTSQEQLFRVRFLYILNNKPSIKKVCYLRTLPTRKELILSAVNNIDDSTDLKDVHICAETVPLRGGISNQLVNIKFRELCVKLFRG